MPFAFTRTQFLKPLTSQLTLLIHPSIHQVFTSIDFFYPFVPNPITQDQKNPPSPYLLCPFSYYIPSSSSLFRQQPKLMGCCIGKPSARPSPAPKPSHAPPLRLLSPLYYATDPSPVPPEEEAVKEIVLAETPPLPLPPPPPPPVHTLPPPAKEHDSPLIASMPQPLASSPSPKSALRKLDAAATDGLISKLEEAAGVVSEYSDMCTLSGSLTASTTPTTGTAATLNDSEATSKASWQVTRTPPNRVSRRLGPVIGRDERPERGVGSQSRRVQRQPSSDRGRRGTSQGSSETGGGVRWNSSQVGRVVEPRRRSSSPAQGRAGDRIRGGTGKSPSRRGVSAGTRSTTSSTVLSGSGSENGSNNPRRRKRREDADGNDAVAGESLDNPHVSLECFIFL